MKNPSESVKIPRRAAEVMLKLANQIGAIDRTDKPGLTSGEAYAHALGWANALGKEIAAYMTAYLENDND